MDEAALSQLTPQEQKQIIGEHLYPIIHAMNPQLAGKLTGMMLELDNSDLLELFNNPNQLRIKIEEATAVLSNASRS
jgi:polyadenylate-binding protein